MIETRAKRKRREEIALGYNNRVTRRRTRETTEDDVRDILKSDNIASIKKLVEDTVIELPKDELANLTNRKDLDMPHEVYKALFEHRYEDLRTNEEAVSNIVGQGYENQEFIDISVKIIKSDLPINNNILPQIAVRGYLDEINALRNSGRVDRLPDDVVFDNREDSDSRSTISTLYWNSQYWSSDENPEHSDGNSEGETTLPDNVSLPSDISSITF